MIHTPPRLKSDTDLYPKAPPPVLSASPQLLSMGKMHPTNTGHQGMLEACSASNMALKAYLVGVSGGSRVSSSHFPSATPQDPHCSSSLLRSSGMGEKG